MSAGETGPVTKALWPHQEQAVKAIVAAIGDGGRCQAIAACGTGKTLIGAEVSRDVAPAGRVLVVVPTLELLAQTARAYASHLGERAGLIAAACSEISATIEAAEIRSEMAHMHAGVSTDPAVVAMWARQPGRVTMLATYHSLPVITAAHAGGAPPWDLLVVDEAHRSAGLAGRAWSAVHDDTAVPARRRLYMTATPRIIGNDLDATSMDDTAVFGPEVWRLTFADAISAGLLADYRVVVPVTTSAEAAAIAAGMPPVSAGGPAVPADMLAAQVALLKACREWGLRRVITYHRRVLRAHRFAQTLANAADLLPEGETPPRLRASAVDGSMPLWQRRDILRHLDRPADRTVVVSNARVLSEGVDVPELDSVMFADPRDSGTDVVQAVGRALRRGASGTKVATIIIPVLIEDGESAAAALEGSEFAAVWRVVRALRAHDERVADWLDSHRALMTASGAWGTGTPPALPSWLTVRGIPVTARFASALTLRIVGAATSAWADCLRHAAAYAAEHGSLDVPVRAAGAGGFPLGRWLADQRSRRKRGELTDPQIAALDALGMRWDILGAARERFAAEARAYRDRHGNLDVLRKYRTADGYPLGEQVHRARNRYRMGRLTRSLAAELTALGMTWDTVTAGRDAEIGRARAYHAEHGHIDMPYDYVTPDGCQLGKWLTRQRTSRRAGTIHPDRQAALDELGVNWDPSPDGWGPWLDRARAYAAAHGNLDVPLRYQTPDGYRLGAWMSQRRAEHQAGKLQAGRASALENLGITWSPLLESWKTGLRHAAAYAAEHGSLAVPVRYVTPDGHKLGMWLNNQRRRHRDGKMSPEREKELGDLGIKW